MRRLDVNGYTTGTLQVFLNGAWGAVCNSNFDTADATVGCRQLGFKSGVIPPQEAAIAEAVRHGLPNTEVL